MLILRRVKGLAQAGRLQVDLRLLVLCMWWPIPLSGMSDSCLIGSETNLLCFPNNS